MKLTVVSPLRRGRLLWAFAAVVALASCEKSPTAPTPAPAAPAVATASISSVTPESPIRAESAQLLRITGVGFRPGLALQIMDPGNLFIMIPSENIQNLMPTSFEAAVFLRQAGRYSLVIRQQDGQTSGAFALDVRNEPPTTPQIDSVSPSQTIVDTLRQPVALMGLHFDTSLSVHIVDPEGALTVKSSPDVVIENGSLIQFTMVFTKVGIYRFSLWNRDGQVSNAADVRVR